MKVIERPLDAGSVSDLYVRADAIASYGPSLARLRRTSSG